MNRLFTKQQAVAEYRLPVHLQAELFRAVQPVEKDGQAEPLYLEAQLDRWLADRFGAGQVPAPSEEPFMTIRETARLLHCSYTEARERMLDGRIRTIRDGRWLRTRREWIEAYIAEKTIKATSSDPDVSIVPNPLKRRQGQITFKKGSIGEQFLREREENAKKNKG
jgi:hypothetical protein